MGRKHKLTDSQYSDWGEKISSYFPKFNISNNKIVIYKNFMVFIAIMGCIPLSLQAYKVYQTGNADGISIPAFIFQIFISASWVTYAILNGIGIMAISSTLIILAAVTLIFLTWRCRRNK